ncbi:MAG: PEP/pyruvate-binding domain-containing protein [Myxococcota bacterium]
MAELLPLSEAHAPACGGKARGLCRLIELGLPVPEGFVLTGLRAGDDLHARLGDRVREGRWAVRSSAVGEDGEAHSFAGQYVTHLDRVGRDAVVEAVWECVASAAGERVEAYVTGQAAGTGTEVAVVVQRMVPAAWAGVLFTADPVSGYRGRWVLDVVEGLGEALVSGEASGVRSVYDRRGRRLEGPGLPDAAERALLEGARALQDALGRPVDIELALDDAGRLWFLQGRPVTALPRVHPNELDTALDAPGAVYTTGNVSEMMPGPVTPLTGSVFGRAVDHGMQEYMQRIGAQGAITEAPRYLFASHQHMFIRLDAVYASPRKCLGGTKRDVDLSIVGRPVPEAELGPVKPWFRRAPNVARLASYLRSAPKRLEALEAMVAGFSLPDEGSAASLYAALDAAQAPLSTAYGHHYAASVWSGTWLAVMTGAIAGRGEVATNEHLALISALLTDIPEVESADAVSALSRLGRELRDHPDVRSFTAAGVPEALAWLRREAPGAVDAFVMRHGHRCLREAELRTRPWRDDPEAWVPTLQAVAGQASEARDEAPVEVDALLEGLAPSARRTLRFALPRARRGVVLRERSKSALIAFQDHLKRGYRRLGERLAATGALPDGDLVYFFTHEELARVVAGEGEHALAEARRAQLPELWELAFPLVSVGPPEPLHRTRDAIPNDGSCWAGMPVSRGVAEGRAVVAHRLADARRLSAGDVLIARTTDIGWSPWFGVAGAIVTEIGSPLSHGAVVAREYGIPAVVGVAGATEIPDGARLRVDGTAGTVELLEGEPSPDGTPARAEPAQP